MFTVVGYTISLCKVALDEIIVCCTSVAEEWPIGSDETRADKEAAGSWAAELLADSLNTLVVDNANNDSSDIWAPELKVGNTVRETSLDSELGVGGISEEILVDANWGMEETLEPNDSTSDVRLNELNVGMLDDEVTLAGSLRTEAIDGVISPDGEVIERLGSEDRLWSIHSDSRTTEDDDLISVKGGDESSEAVDDKPARLVSDIETDESSGEDKGTAREVSARTVDTIVGSSDAISWVDSNTGPMEVIIGSIDEPRWVVAKCKLGVPGTEDLVRVSETGNDMKGSNSEVIAGIRISVSELELDPALTLEVFQ